MKRELINKNFAISRVEVAIEEVISIVLSNLSLKATVYKFANNEADDCNEIKWDIHIKNEKEALEFSNMLKGTNLGLDIDHFSKSDDGYIVSVFYYWSSDCSKKDEILRSDRELVKNIEDLYSIQISKGTEDMSILQGVFYWGNVEKIIFD